MYIKIRYIIGGVGEIRLVEGLTLQKWLFFVRLSHAVCEIGLIVVLVSVILILTQHTDIAVVVIA